MNPTIPHNLYFHVPFCASKCNYCAFYSCAIDNFDGGHVWNSYLKQILSEIDFWAARMGKIPVTTIFFGGGTPSLMPTDVFAQIMTAVKTRFDVELDCEVTLESNPGTINAARLAEFQSAGVNRLSIGVQALNDTDLEFLGRRHDVATALELIKTATGMGLRVSADFIYGLPGQTVADVKKLCGQINKLNLEHCSMYELSIEPGTPFAKMNLTMPDNETMAKMYEAIGDTLRLSRYEVSNYGTPCRHNHNIWDGAPYLGFGRGAAGRPLIDGVWYDQRGGEINFAPIDENTRALEKVMTGLRTARGINLSDDVYKIINWEFVGNHPELLTTDDSRLTATKKGLLILDDLLVNLIR